MLGRTNKPVGALWSVLFAAGVWLNSGRVAAQSQGEAVAPVVANTVVPQPVEAVPSPTPVVSVSRFEMSGPSDEGTLARLGGFQRETLRVRWGLGALGTVVMPLSNSARLPFPFAWYAFGGEAWAGVQVSPSIGLTARATAFVNHDADLVMLRLGLPVLEVRLAEFYRMDFQFEVGYLDLLRSKPAHFDSAVVGLSFRLASPLGSGRDFNGAGHRFLLAAQVSYNRVLETNGDLLSIGIVLGYDRI